MKPLYGTLEGSEKGVAAGSGDVDMYLFPHLALLANSTCRARTGGHGQRGHVGEEGAGPAGPPRLRRQSAALGVTRRRRG